MHVTRPVFYSSFQCTAGRCSDTCCAGWEVSVDANSLARYRAVPGGFGRLLNDSLVPDGDSARFRTDPAGRCALLRPDGLCELICRMGEDALCEICAQHPRFHEWFGAHKESGLGLCCEEAARLWLTGDGPIRFETVQTPEASGAPVDPDRFHALLHARDAGFSLLQNRQLPFRARLSLLLALGTDIQLCLERKDLGALHQAAAAYGGQDGQAALWARLSPRCDGRGDPCASFLGLAGFLRRQEPMDPAWPERMARLEDACGEFPAWARRLQQAFPAPVWYEHAAVYFLYRYFLKALFDGDVLGRCQFAVLSTLALCLLDAEMLARQGELCQRPRIGNAKAYSKELEYNPDAMAGLAGLLWEDERFSLENLFALAALFSSF